MYKKQDELLPLDEVLDSLNDKEPEGGWDSMDYYKDVLPEKIYLDDLVEIFNDDNDAMSILNSSIYQKKMAALSKYAQFKEDIQASNKPDQNWRLNIDPIHQIYGPTAYNKGSAASDNEFKDKGDYLSNMRIAEDYLDKRLTGNPEIDLDLYTSLYKLVMSGSNNRLEEKSFRDCEVTTTTGQYGYIDEDRLETVKYNEKGGPSEYLKKTDPIRKSSFVAGINGYYSTDQKVTKEYLADCFSQYNIAIKQAKTSDEKLLAIATLYQQLECNHPYQDGNGRTNRLLLNGLLKANNLGKTILSNPSCAHFMNVNSIVKEIKRGQIEYKYAESLDSTDWVVGNRHLIVWERKNGVIPEYSIELGVILQNIWKKINRTQNLLDDLALVHQAEDNAIPDVMKEKFEQRFAVVSAELKQELASCGKELASHQKSIEAYSEDKKVTLQRKEATELYFPNNSQKSAGSRKKNRENKENNENQVINNSGKQSFFAADKNTRILADKTNGASANLTVTSVTKAGIF